jgi:hypothetical protein
MRIKFKYFNPKKYDPGSSSRIRMLTFYPSRISDPGVEKALAPGSRIRISNTVFLQYRRDVPKQMWINEDAELRHCESFLSENPEKLKLPVVRSWVNR